MTEIEAMSAINDALEPLNEDERVRILEWAVSKFVVARFDRLRSLQDEVKNAENDAIKGITKVMNALTETAKRLNVPTPKLIAIIERLATDVQEQSAERGS